MKKKHSYTFSRYLDQYLHFTINIGKISESILYLAIIFFCGHSTFIYMRMRSYFGQAADSLGRSSSGGRVDISNCNAHAL